MDFLLRSKKLRTAPPNRQQVMHIYRGILKQARSFFDENAREFIQSFAQKKFRIGIHDRKPGRPRIKLRNARATMHLLERANMHRFKDVVSVLEYAYGRKGPRRTDMLKATAGIGKREEIFGNLRQVAHYRPAFYAIAQNQYGEKKLEVNPNVLKSRHPLNVAKMQDMHWADIRRKVLPPVDTDIMRMLEGRAQYGEVDTTVGLEPEMKDLVRKWEARWVNMPPKRQVVRYYRALLEQVTEMRVEQQMVPNTGKYVKSMARHNTRTAAGLEKPDFVPKSTYSFTRSSIAGKRPPPSVNSIDIAGLDQAEYKAV
ncbi:hypothetical protein LPJ66_003449 [Kickxella alabastrina]|uniref:Uncharacterized protein n=1 Tax=Kickxella alabastrina TaxID=61397 RepID=A0ACC1INT5_9FUNG|nr:hypothetical protein LPJ66_003449 [Kickxella alabastrina]